MGATSGTIDLEAVAGVINAIVCNTIATGVPAKEIGSVTQTQITAWNSAKELYQSLTIDYPEKLKIID